MTTQNPYEAPQADISRTTPTAPPQTWQWLLFSFDGRIPRRSFWGVSLGMMVAYLLVGFVLGMVLGGESSAVPVILMVLYIPAIWISLAVQVKRWHDRDKSGWWVLIGFIPLVGPIWAFVETGCLRGTIGPNSYGPDPT